MTDACRTSPHVARNAAPIAEVLAECLPDSGQVLEVASGTGEHVVRFARAFPGLLWQPSDPDPVARQSIRAWAAEARLDNIRDPIALDVRDHPWPVEPVEAMLCINMVHISPWEATLALLQGAEEWLRPGGPLYLYGPYFEADVPTAPSNLAFDASLRARHPEWGLRCTSDVMAAAEQRGLHLQRRVAMPANNLSLVFRRYA